MEEGNKKLVWVAQIVLVIGFLFFGIFKFITAPEDAADIFGKIGGTISQYLTGVYEVVSAILSIFPATAFIGALMVVISMTTAIILHLTIIGYSGFNLYLMIAAIIFLLIAIYVMKKRKEDFFMRKKN